MSNIPFKAKLWEIFDMKKPQNQRFWRFDAERKGLISPI
jgi:hypothetical protein